MVTKEEWIDWKKSHVTQEFLKDLISTREGKKNDIAEGKVDGNELYREIGRTQGIQDCIEYALKSFNHVELERDELNESEGSSF